MGEAVKTDYFPGGFPAPPDGWTSEAWADFLEERLDRGVITRPSVRRVYRLWIDHLRQDAKRNTER